MTQSAPLPIPVNALRALWQAARKRPLSGGTGALLRRSLGHSLDYREHRSYARGDDVRHIDWRASARLGRSGEYLVRTYEAEQQFRILVIVDGGPSMRLPHRFPKLTFALWIAECFALIAEWEQLEIGFAALAAGPQSPRYTRGTAIGGTFEAFARELGSQDAALMPDRLPFRAVDALPPASVTLLVSDFYLAEPGELRRLVDRAARGRRQAVLCELDTWPYERSLLSGQMVRLLPVGAAARSGDFEPSAEEIAAADHNIETLRRNIPDRRMSGVVRKTWTGAATSGDAAAEFRAWFPGFLSDSEILGGRT